MTITTMRASTGTHVVVIGASLPVLTAPRAQKLRVAPFAPWIADNSRKMSAWRYRHT
jgi:hypothetical protein